MIGLEYICKLYRKSYNSVAEELGISRQSINGWVKGARKIPKKHLSKLSEIFDGLDEEYFQKELTELDKIEIQQDKILSDAEEIEYEIPTIDEETGQEYIAHNTFLDLDDFRMEYLNFEKDKILLRKNIIKQIQDKFDNNVNENGCYSALEEAKFILKIYKKLIKVIKHGGIRIETIDNVLNGMINYEHDFWGLPLHENDFTKKIEQAIKEEEDRLMEEVKIWLDRE